MKRERIDPAVKAILDMRKKKLTQAFVEKYSPVVINRETHELEITEHEIFSPEKRTFLILDGKTPDGQMRLSFSDAGLNGLEGAYLATYPEAIRKGLKQKLPRRKGKNSFVLMWGDMERAEAAYFKENPSDLADVIEYGEKKWKDAWERLSLTDRLSKKDFLDIRRGRKVLKSASKGGKARASKYDWVAIQGEAETIWKERPHLSKSQVADNLKKKLTIVTPSISRIRQIIKKPL